MARPPRKPGWSPITLTISDEIATALRVRGAVTGEEIGQIADQILRATLEPILEPVKALSGSLEIRPLLPGTASAESQQPSGSIPIPVPGKKVAAQPTNQPSFDDPSVRAEYEARFLEEALDSARRDFGWEPFLEKLKYEAAEAHAMGSHLIRADNIEQEVGNWIAAKRVPTRWKERLFSALGGSEPWVWQLTTSAMPRRGQRFKCLTINLRTACRTRFFITSPVVFA